MILTDVVARAVADGTITVVFRRWATARVRAGSTLRTSAGVIAIDAVDEVDPDLLGRDDLEASGHGSVAALRASLPDVPGLDGAGRRWFRIRVRAHGPDPRVALAATRVTADEAERITARLDRLDARSPRGPWTRAVLETVAAHPARRAGDLAALLGREKDPFKREVRTLTGLGLTLSLDVGYRLSPRGESYLEIGRP